MFFLGSGTYFERIRLVVSVFFLLFKILWNVLLHLIYAYIHTLYCPVTDNVHVKLSNKLRKLKNSNHLSAFAL